MKVQGRTDKQAEGGGRGDRPEGQREDEWHPFPGALVLPWSHRLPGAQVSPLCISLKQGAGFPGSTPKASNSMERVLEWLQEACRFLQPALPIPGFHVQRFKKPRMKFCECGIREYGGLAELHFFICDLTNWILLSAVCVCS